MKKPWSILIWLIPAALLLYSFFMIKRAATPPLPPFRVLLLDSTTILNTNDIPKGKPSILLFFSPDCDHCQREIKSIIQNIDSLRDVNLFLITVDPFDRMKVFNNVYKLFKYPNIVLARDYAFAFPYNFKNAQPPYNAIYDRHKRLISILPRETNAHELLSYLNKH